MEFWIPGTSLLIVLKPCILCISAAKTNLVGLYDGLDSIGQEALGKLNFTYKEIR